MPAGAVDAAWPHLNPESAAQIAHGAGARKLMLVHFDAVLYKDMQARIEAEKAAAEIFSETRAARDGMVLELEP